MKQSTSSPVMSPKEVRKLRLKMNLSQAKLAAMLGCRSNTVYRWEAGLHPPAEPTARLLRVMAQIEAKDRALT